MADEKILIEVEIDNEDAKKNEAELIALIERQRQELQRRRKELKESNGTNKEAAKRIGELSRQIKSNTTQLRNEQKALKANDNSINALRASVSRLTAERNNLDTSSKEGRAEFNRLTQAISDQTEQLKELEGQVGDFRRNVGNYTQGVKEAFAGTEAFSGGFENLFAVAALLRTGIGQLIPLLKTLRGALIALPILAIVAALASLVTFFTKTREGANILERALGSINAVITKLTKDFASGGKAIFDSITNIDFSVEALQEGFINLGKAIVENVVNRFKSIQVFGDAVAKLFEGEFSEAAKTAGTALVQLATGLDEAQQEAVAETFTDYAKAVAETAKAGFNAADSNIRLRAAIRDANLEAAKQQNLAEQNRKLRDDERKSLEERLEANNAVLEAERLRTQAQERAVRARLQILENERKLNGEFTEEQLEQVNELNVQLLEIQEDFAGRTTEQLTEEVAITREAEAQKAQARIDGLTAQSLALDEGSKELLDKQIEIANAEAELAKTQAEAEITNEENLSQKLLLIEAERLKAIKDLRNSFLEEEQEARDKIIQEQIKAAEKEKALAQEVAKAQQAKAQAVAETAVQIGIAAGEEADSFEGATKVVVNSIREQVKAFLNKALAAQLAKVIADPKIPFPVNLIIAGTATAALNILFEKLVPGFATGGIVNSGLPVSRSNGDNRLITAKTGEVVLNRSQRARVGDGTLARAGVPGFATGGVIGGSNIGTQITSNAINSDVQNAQSIAADVADVLRSMPAPVLDYKEFTTFTNRVSLKENRASV